jgi:pectate lyase
MALLIAVFAMPSASAAKPNWKSLNAMPSAWFKSPDGQKILTNVLSHQANAGDWPKNTDTTATEYKGDRTKLIGTFDNGATVQEIRFLAHAYQATHESTILTIINKSIDHILKAQYQNGGWPQSFPLQNGYRNYITFNDDTVVHLIDLLREAYRDPLFSFLDPGRRDRCRAAFDRGIECILATQIKVDGKLTVWCAQHDEVTLKPRNARSFELAALSGGESASILMLLMSLDSPSPSVIEAIEAGVTWFEKSKIIGLKQTEVNGDKVMIADPSAHPIWARFYKLEDNRPFFAGRDGVMKFSITEIEPERRNGYAWYGTWGEKVINQYAKWHLTIQAKKVEQKP